MTITLARLRFTPKVLARLSDATSADVVDGGGDLLADALNQLGLLWQLTSGQIEDEGDAIDAARVIGDVGMRLRRAALKIGLVQGHEDNGLHVQPGPTQGAINDALYVLRELLATPERQRVYLDALNQAEREPAQAGTA